MLLLSVYGLCGFRIIEMNLVDIHGQLDMAAHVNLFAGCHFGDDFLTLILAVGNGLSAQQLGNIDIHLDERLLSGILSDMAQVFRPDAQPVFLQISR